jgi:hypothetical protein
MLQARQLAMQRRPQPLGAVPIGNIGGVHQRTHDQTLGIDQQVALAAIDFLAAVITPRTAHHSGFDRLAIEDGRRWLGIAPQLHADGGVQGSMEPLPEALHTPQAKVVIRRFPRRQIMGQQSPGAATAQDIENSIQDFPHRVTPRPAPLLGSRQVRCEQLPCSIRHIRGISCSIHRPYSVGTAKGTNQFSDSL